MYPAFLFHVPFRLPGFSAGGARIKLKIDIVKLLNLAGFVEDIC